VFIAAATGQPDADDDAEAIGVFDLWELPADLCFDHSKILNDYLYYRYYGIRPRPQAY
jgi:8-oxo-dGTP diphosphatase